VAGIGHTDKIMQCQKLAPYIRLSRDLSVIGIRPSTITEVAKQIKRCCQAGHFWLTAIAIGVSDLPSTEKANSAKTKTLAIHLTLTQTLP